MWGSFWRTEGFLNFRRDEGPLEMSCCVGLIAFLVGLGRRYEIGGLGLGPSLCPYSGGRGYLSFRAQRKLSIGEQHRAFLTGRESTRGVDEVPAAPPFPTGSVQPSIVRLSRCQFRDLTCVKA